MRTISRSLSTFGAAALWVIPSLCAAGWIETAELTHAGGADGDQMGRSVAIDGSVAVVGISRPAANALGAGTASVFLRSGNTWTEAAQLVPSSSIVGDQFGASVAIRGNTIAVGAPTVGITGGRQGVIYVFVRPAGGWSGTLNETARLEVPGGVPTDFFGNCVAFSDDSIVSGDPGQNTLFVFNEPASGWSGTINPAATLVNTGGGTLGNSVAASGGVVIAGAEDAMVGRFANAGVAYVFIEPTGGWSGSVSSSAVLRPSDPSTGGFFGFSTAIDGTTAVIGSPLTAAAAGKVYVFNEPATGWAGSLNEDAQLVASDAASDLELGFAVAISGPTIVSGAPFEAFTISGQSGRAYVFKRPLSGWSGTLPESQQLQDPAATPDNFFGWSVAMSGTTIVVGAIFEPVDTVFPGAAFVYDLVSRFSTRTRFLIEGPIRVAPGVPVEFPVQVLAGPRAPSQPTGEVLITDAFGQSCRARLSDTGQGSCALTFPNAGRFLVVARYEGNAEFRQSMSPPVMVIVSVSGGRR